MRSDKSMNILIIKPLEDCNEGVFTPGRGPSVHSLVWAKFLADCGNRVIVTSKNKPDEKYSYNNVLFYTIDEVKALNITFDVVIGVCANFEELSEYRYDKVIMDGFDPPNLNYIEDIPKDVIFAAPYNERRLEAVKQLGYKAGLLPMMFSSSFKESKFDNKSVFCAYKYPFHTEWSEEQNNVSLIHYELMLDLVKNGYKVSLVGVSPGVEGFSVVYKKNHVNLDFEGKFLFIIEELKKYRSFKSYPILSFDLFKNLVEKHSICLPFNSCAGMGISLIKGVVPLVWEDFGEMGFIDESFRGNLGITSGYAGLTKDIIFDRTYKLLTDADYYELELETLRKHSSIFSKEEALNYFHALIN